MTEQENRDKTALNKYLAKTIKGTRYKQSLQSEYDSIGKEQTKTVTELAYAEVISYNKKSLERELQNENRQ